MDRAALTVGPDRFLVWGRAVVVGTVALATGVVSHVAGGGLLPGPVALVCLLVVSVVLAARFLLVRTGATRLVLLVVAGQTLAHGALSTLAGHRGESGSSGASSAAAPSGTSATPDLPVSSGRRTGNLHDHYEAATPVTSAEPGVPGGWLTHQAEHLVEQGPLMVLTHLVGAALLGLFLAVGERSLWRLLLLVAARQVVALTAGRALATAHEVRAGQLRLPGPAVVLGRTRLEGGSRRLERDPPTRRGPPFALAA